MSAREPEVEPHVRGDAPTLLDAQAGGGADERLAAGVMAGDYEVERFLGAGAMGDVYAGLHPLIGKRVAIKVIKRRLAASAEATERFLREARAANQVGHANVVDVFALGRLSDGRLYLVMDLLDGEPLSARLGRKRLAPQDALALLGPIAAALDAAHARGVVHRDLKPDNVFVSGPPDGPRVHVLDFGIAKLLADGDAKPDTLTGEGAWLGTPAYMAPEQWSADGAGPASDRYALGVIAYQMLAGDVPFRAGSLPQMMEKHFRAPVPPLATGQGDVALPPAVDEVLAKALAKDPDARFASAGAMVAALAAASGTARGAGAVTMAGARTPARMPRAAIVGGVLALGAAGVGMWIIARDRTPAAGAAADTDREHDRPPQVEVLTDPAGARVLDHTGRGRVTPRDRGVTPTTIELDGTMAAVTLVKPGYGTIEARIPIGRHIVFPLSKVTGFAGTWAMADGTLRAFERRGDEVAAFALERADGDRHFLRMFAFGAADAVGETTFVATEDHVDERAPDEPSCRIAVRAEYRYQPLADALDLRKERASYDLVDGRCVVHAIAWGDREPLRRIGDRGPDVTEATGASEPKLPDLQKSPAPVGQPPGPNDADATAAPDVPTQSNAPSIPTKRPVKGPTKGAKRKQQAPPAPIAPGQANAPPPQAQQAPVPQQAVPNAKGDAAMLDPAQRLAPSVRN